MTTELRLLYRNKRFALFSLHSPPKTLWYNNKNRIRDDQLFGLRRAYNRETRHYIYKLYLGRYMYIFYKIEQ